MPNRSRLVLALTSVVGILAFTWPLFIQVTPALIAHPTDGPILVTVLVPLLLAIAVTEISQGKLDSKQIALLGMLTALTAALRPLGAGALGIEPMWFVIIMGGSVFGPSFGFLLGSLSLFVSAFITGGLGPWLPFQMLAAAWIGAGAGLIKTQRIIPLSLYTVAACFFFGLAMDLQFWPWVAGTSSTLSYQPGGAVLENFRHFFVFHFASSMAWDLPRALTNLVLILTLGRPVIHALQRARRRGGFDNSVTFAS